MLCHVHIAVISLTSSVLVLAFIPETKGKSLEALERGFVHSYYLAWIYTYSLWIAVCRLSGPKITAKLKFMVQHCVA